MEYTFRKIKARRAKTGIDGMTWVFFPQIAPDDGKNLENPESGWFRVFPLSVAKRPDTAYLESCLAPTECLVMVELFLEGCANRALNAEEVLNAEAILRFFQEEEKQVIVRPTYDLIGEALKAEPQKIGIIEGHLRQLGAIFKKYESAIFMVQGLALGNWGEMHGSRFMTRSSVTGLYRVLREAVGNKMWIALRRPRYMRWILKEVGKSERVCLFNDAILSSETDLGTYVPDEWPGPGTWYDPWVRDKELDFQNFYCLRRPNGGEAPSAVTSPDRTREDSKKIVKTLERMHLSYLNAQFDPKTFELWKKMPAWHEDMFGVDAGGFGKEPRTLYDEISRRLGYRYLLEGAHLEEYVEDFGQRRDLFFTVYNDGFANYPGTLYGELIVDHKKIDLGDAPLKWNPGYHTSFTVRLPALESGSHTVSIRVRNEKKEPIHFANRGAEWADEVPAGVIVVMRNG